MQLKPVFAPWLRPISILLFFLAIPLIFISLEADSFNERVIEEARLRDQETLRIELQAWKRNQSGYGWVLARLVTMANQVFAAPSPREKFLALRKEIRQELGLSIEFMVFNEAGKQVEAFSDVLLPTHLRDWIASDLASFDQGVPGPIQSRLPAYQAFFGPLFSRFLEGRHARGLGKVHPLAHRRFLFISKSYRQGRILAFVDEPEDWGNLWFQWNLDARLREMPEWRGAVLNRREDPLRLKASFGVAWESFFQANLQFGRFAEKALLQDGWHWVQVPLNQDVRLILGCPDRQQSALQGARHQLFMRILAVSLAVLTLLILWIRFGKPEVPLSLRLFLLLAYVVGLPLLVCTISLRDLERDLREGQLRKWQDRQVRVLEELDLCQTDFLGSIERRLKKDFQVLPGEKSPERPLKERIRQTIDDLAPLYIALMDAGGKTLCEWNSVNASLPASMKKIIGRGVAALFRGDVEALRSGENPQESLLAATSDLYGFNAGLIMAMVTGSPGQFLSLSFLNSDWSLLLNLVPDLKGEPKYSVVSIWEERPLGCAYLKACLASYSERTPEMLLLARMPWNTDLDLPRNSPLLEAVDQMQIFGKHSNEKMLLRTRVASTPMLVTGIRGKALRSFWLFAGTPEERIFTPLDHWPWRTVLLGVLLLLAGGLIARQLSQGFLSPIREFTLGVGAMQNRDFGYRIPDIGTDELGRLGEAFNGMLEGMRDLELARILQENIYPRNEADLGNGWTVYGSCRSAGQVGGDFYDYFQVRDGRWAIIIGDVSGHGVPAAMVVALAKGLFTHPGNEPDPVKVLNAVQQVFFQVLYRKKMMMTCLFSLFDPKTGILEFGNAGHNDPYVLNHVEGAVEALVLRGMPLGIRKARFEKVGRREIRSGETLLFYTDGLVEALDREGEPVGYGRLEAALRTLPEGEVRDLDQKVRAWHQSLAAPGPQADDISLLMLRRRTVNRQS